jgi:hypothetical protein
MKKLNSNFVKKQFEAKGWKLHDDYENSRTLMETTCPSGHDTQMSWNNKDKDANIVLRMLNLHTKK